MWTVEQMSRVWNLRYRLCVFVESSKVAVMAKTMFTDCDYEVGYMQCKCCTQYSLAHWLT